LYFPPSLNDENIDENSYTYDEFVYGEPSQKINNIIEQINGKQAFVEF